MSLLVTEGLVDEFAVRKRLLLWDESIMGALCNLHRFFAGRSHLPETVVEFLTRQMQYHLFDLSHHTSKADPFTRETTV